MKPKAQPAGTKTPPAKGAAKPVQPNSKSAAKSVGKAAATKAAPTVNGVVRSAAAGRVEAKVSAKSSTPTQSGSKAPAAKAPGKPDPKAPVKSTAKQPSKVSTKDTKSASKSSSKPAAETGKSATKAGAAAKAPAKGSEKSAKADKTTASAGGKKSSGKKSAAKRGPIDMSTAKSVAAVAAASQADSSGYVVINGRRVRMISTKGLPAPKRPKAIVEKEVEKPEIQVASIKTKLSKKELDEYRTLLLTKRRQIVGTISGLEDEALRSNGGNLSNMPLHMADIGTDTFDQDFTLGMAQAERQTLTEIDAALARIESKTYGVCQLTGKPIPKARLEAKPWAKFSIEAAKLVERGVVPR